MADNRFLAAVGVIVFLGTLAFPFVVETGVKDSAQDWIVLQAGWTGRDVSRPVNELARSLGYESSLYAKLPLVRPPAFFLAYAAVGFNQTFLIWFVILANAAAMSWLVVTISRYWSLKRFGCVVLAGILVASVANSLAWVNPVPLWSAMVIKSWMRLDGTWVGGIPLGIVSALRLWPLLAVVLLVTRRRPVGMGALCTALVLTVGGLLIVGPADSLRAFTSATAWADTDLWNVSLSWALSRLGVPIAVTVLVGSAVVLLALRRNRLFTAYGIAIGVSILLSPLGWPEYFSATSLGWPAAIRRGSHTWRRADGANRPPAPP
jgi:hypothetical protein